LEGWQDLKKYLSYYRARRIRKKYIARHRLSQNLADCRKRRISGFGKEFPLYSTFPGIEQHPLVVISMFPCPSVFFDKAGAVV
jgi:hypothetical protein